MAKENPIEILVHPELGELPAKKLLDCIFALSPDQGPILHYHVEEMTATSDNQKTIYTPNGESPLPERSRCQIIPPMIPEFPKVG